MRARLLLSTSAALGALTAGCSEPAGTHGGLTEAEARQAGQQVALEERARSDSDLYRVALDVTGLDERVFASGVEYWDVTLSDPEGVRRVCVRLRSGGRSISVRRCDPPDAPAPAQPEDDTGEPA